MARGRNRVNRRRGRRRGPLLPITRQSVPADPPVFVSCPPRVRRVQLAFKGSGSVSCTPQEFFKDTFGTSTYSTIIIYGVRVWSSASSTSAASLVVKAGSPQGSTVPAVEFNDTSAPSKCARVGYTLTGPCRVPWPKSSTFVTIAASLFPVTVELTGLFI